MLNQIVLVGRITDKPSILKNDEICYYKLILSVPRNYKNKEGEYEIDYIPCLLGKGIGENVSDYCSKRDILGVKAHIESVSNEIKIIAEKVTFLSSKNKE